MKKYVEVRRNMWKIWRNMKEYDGKCGKYEGIWRNMWLWEWEERSTERSEVRVVIYTFLPIQWPWNLKNSELFLYRLWGLEKFRASPRVQALGLGRAKRGASRRIYLSPYIKALGLGKISSFPHIGSGSWKIPSLTPYTYIGSETWNSEVRVVVHSFLFM